MDRGQFSLKIPLDKEMEIRKRDFMGSLDIDAMSRQMNAAKERGLRVIPLVDKNRAQFAQMIAPNMRHLVKQKYLTTPELAFLTSICGNIEMHSNAIVSYEDNGMGQYLKVTDIAKLMNYSERQARRLISSLIEKGIIYEYVDSLSMKKYGRVVEERPLFLNPEIVFSGNRNKINATLCRLVINADHLEKASKDKKSIKLPWKLWIEHGCEFGRLYRRDTWLKKKKEPQKKKK
jgi:DNA-binding MarR family transcriptional regulator